MPFLTICAQKTELIGVFYVELFSAESLVAAGYLALALVFSDLFILNRI
jgi:hypothetical protein